MNTFIHEIIRQSSNYCITEELLAYQFFHVIIYSINFFIPETKKEKLHLAKKFNFFQIFN